MAQSLEVLVIRSELIKLANLLEYSGIASASYWTLHQSGWKRIPVPDHDQLWLCKSPTLILGGKDGRVANELPTLSVGLNSQQAIRDFVRSLSEMGSCIFSWGLPGAYDFSLAVVAENPTFRMNPAAVVRRTRFTDSWSLRGAVVFDGAEMFRTLWRRSGLLHLVAMDGVCSGSEERYGGKLTKLEEFCGGDNTGWNRFECTSLEVGLEITRPNRGGAYVSVWPAYSPSETINRVLSTWESAIDLGFPVEYCELEQGLWCALFGSGMEDCSMACFCGDVEASFKLDYPFNAGF